MARKYYYGRRKSTWRGYALPVLIIGALVALGWWGWGPGAKRTAQPQLVVGEDSSRGAAPSAAQRAQQSRLANATKSSRDEVLAPRDGAGSERRGPATAQPATDLAAALPDPAVSARAPSRPKGPTLLEANAPAESEDTPASHPVAPHGPQPRLAADQSPAPVSASASVIEAARRRAAQDPIGARRDLNARLNGRLSPSEERAVRAELARLAEQTLFSSNKDANDPLVTIYTIAENDNLQKIGRRFKTPYELIMQINNIRDPRRIRAGQTLKVPNGPFHAKISKSQFRMDLYLQDTYVRSYQVGLGKDAGTPEGEWFVKNKLPNPTYYPPASAERKSIISPNDPSNPLGEHWIGLEGVSGQAKGQEGFGIHGTIEPDSIGRAASLGCVRMHNEDVAAVYNMLVEKHSTVTTLP